ncbi:hypothetical protein LCGC14_1562590, partial [marine sediment metagenome]
MKEVIKKHKTITITGATAIAALVLLLLNIYEKADAIISRKVSRNPAPIERTYDNS